MMVRLTFLVVESHTLTLGRKEQAAFGSAVKMRFTLSHGFCISLCFFFLVFFLFLEL